MARALLHTRAMRVALLVVVMAVTSGCYVGVKGGPSYHSRAGRAIEKVGSEIEVTAGIEIYLDTPAVLNPLAGKTRVATGGGGFSSSAEAGPISGVARTTAPIEYGQRAVGGLWTVEIGRTLVQTTDGGSARDPRSGALLRAVASFGTGGGSLARIDGDGDVLSRTGMSLLSYSAGIEGAIHGGGSSIDSIGLVLGTGVKVSHYLADDGVSGESITPYISATIEGGVLLQILAGAMKGMGCH